MAVDGTACRVDWELRHHRLVGQPSGRLLSFPNYGVTVKRWIADAAYRRFETIESVCEMLAANLKTGQPRTSKTHCEGRVFTSGSLVIFFRGTGDGVEIIRIVRSERDLDNV